MEQKFKSDLLEQCYNETSDLNNRFPGERTIESVFEQLKFLKKANFSPEKIDERREDLNFGFLGMRFINELDEKLARKLSELNSLI